MGWYYDFKPYIPVAERRRRAMKELEKRRKQGLPVSPVTINGRTIAGTFWGKAWCDNLESYSDYSNRLPRGRTYVRNGSVVHLDITPGKIEAYVSGSELYRIEITIDPLPAAQWKAIKAECGGQVGSLVELLQGKLSKGVMEVVTRKGTGLFPSPREIRMTCSCPDGAYLCKHLAAVMYGIGARLDQKPELLFQLRKVDHLELIAGAVDESTVAAELKKPRGKKTLASADLSDVFGIDLGGDQEEAPRPPVATRAKPAKVTTKATAAKTKPAKVTTKSAPAKAKPAKVTTKSVAAKPAKVTTKKPVTPAAKSAKPKRAPRATARGKVS
ncbi:SWIM zinc finger family protein [Aquisphaera insulae]|uniref:SWIM zinc finger family protein n=1 Tax=Aquisphaera insulae TaxID=2712864 RepID=UPI0013EBD7BC|nr:SWIM zinc finger family protein [Aquisphaera insulae]